MKFTRAIALCALTLAIALAIGAISPYQPYASAGDLQPIFNTAPEHSVPTPALATPEQPAAAPLAEQLPPPTPQVIYIQLPAAPPPQVVFVQAPPAAPPELPPAAPPEPPPAAPPELPPPAAQPELAPLEILHCPCNVLENDPAPAITDRERQQSRQRTR